MPSLRIFLAVLFVSLAGAVACAQADTSGAASRSRRALDWLQLYHEVVAPPVAAGRSAGNGTARDPAAGPAAGPAAELTAELNAAASADPADWPPAGVLRRHAARAARAGTLPVALLDVALDRVAPRFLADVVPPEQFARALREGRPPTVAGRRFAVAALADRTLRGRRVSYVFERALLFTDDPAGPPRITADLADGRGPRPVPLDEPVIASYAVPGRKTIAVTATWPDGRTGVDAFVVEVARLQVPEPDTTWTITAAEPYESGLGSLAAYVYLADGHATLTDPVVLVEGFDITNTRNWPELYELMNQEQLLESIRGEGFDLLAVNFDDATDYIQRHGLATAELLRQVAAAIPAENTIFVIGASMGGLVGRYALLHLESDGFDHRVRTCLSFDSPHQGANIPLGLQHWIDFFAVESAEAEFLRQTLNRPSPRQQLVYHYTASIGEQPAAHSWREVFDQELTLMGGYPRECRLVSVASGSGTGLDQGYPAGDQIILYQYTSFMVDLLGNAWALPDQTRQVIFDGEIDRLWPLPDDRRIVYVGGSLPYDTAPGGTAASMAELDTTAVTYGDVIALHDSHCFVPTISALDVAAAGLGEDLSADPALLARTPFDAIYFPDVNQEHDAINPENAAWIRGEVLGAPTAAPAGPPAAGSLTVSVHPNPFNPRLDVAFELAVSGTV
ncbi:MAG: hypothetical protein R6X25_06770, partial [Candidatus Krumholzibacteriia bacterium]